jgi:predicted GIY-YIG superfamily endonuclease
MGNIEKHPAVYIIANRYRGTIYIGVTSDLWTRVANHKNKSMPGFTSKYGLAKLVWYEHRVSMQTAIAVQFTLALRAIFGLALPTIKQIDSRVHFKTWFEETRLV